MARTLLVVPTGVGVGLSTILLGLERAFEEQGIRVVRFKPIEQNKNVMPTPSSKTIAIQHVEQLLRNGLVDHLLEEILANYNAVRAQADIVLVYGLIAVQDQNYVAQLNLDLAATLDAQVIILTAPGNNTLSQLDDQIEIAARYFGGVDNQRVVGCIINKVNGPVIKSLDARLDLGYLYQPSLSPITPPVLYESASVFQNPQFKLLGCIGWNPQINAPRVKDIADFLTANIIHAGEMLSRRVHYITLCARGVNYITSSLSAGTLIITPGDRSDIIIATCLAALNGIKIAGLLLTGNFQPNENILSLCQQALDTGLPVLLVDDNSFRTAVILHELSLESPEDDLERVEKIKNFVADHLDQSWVKSFVTSFYERHLSPAAFRYQLSGMAKKANKKIVLPEGAEPRTIAAAVACAEAGLAQCILLGNAEEIHRVAKYNAITLSDKIMIVDPEVICERYVKPLVELRKDKGLTEFSARNYLQDPVVLGTMMLQQGDVDGLVSGALHTTANTIRPALQLIKTSEGVKLVSSVFFMCLPDQVLLYADCAVNPDPNVEQLAEIAIQTANTARIFGIEPRVAMISYSTGDSGSGVNVDKVRAATELVKKLCPELLVDGPLQYDAALIPSVAKSKAPQSLVAGRATVVIFPDLNTGNTTYKAVQRSADVLCVGPILQGLRKPVNDLSRGATTDDIIYTIALTAIQA